MIADLLPALRSFLLADAALAAVVGARIHPVVLPQGESRPSIVLTEISGMGDHHAQGPSGLARNRYQIDGYAQTADGADSIARLVQARLDGFKGMMGAVKIQGALFDTWRDDYDSEAELFRVSSDYVIWWEER
jgi:uncharacterized protein DUF3168